MSSSNTDSSSERRAARGGVVLKLDVAPRDAARGTPPAGARDGAGASAQAQHDSVLTPAVVRVLAWHQRHAVPR